MGLRSLLLAATALGAAVAPAVASAQEATLGELIVTARKRQESILNVPVVETAIPQAQLERFQTQDFKDVARRVPGLALGDAVLTIGSQISLRGVGTSTLDAGVDQSIALNLDGMQLTNGLAYSSGMFDVGLVEVLKGPQALFYGKNSPGGVISIRTADPTDRLEVIGRYGYEVEAREHRAELIFSGPVSDTLKLRLATQWGQADGYFKLRGTAGPGMGGRAPSHDRGPTDKDYIVRGTALWQPSSAFDARLKVNLTYDRQEESAHQQLGSCPDGAGPVPPFNIPFIVGEDCKLDRIVYQLDSDPAAFPGVRNAGTPFVDTYQRFGTLELNYRPTADITLTSTTGYYEVQTDAMLNTPPASFAGPSLAADNHYKRHDFTQEVRANSDFAGPLNFTIGGFFQDAQADNVVNLLGNTAIFLPRVVAAGTHHMDIRSYSAFGQVRWTVTPALEVALGARWTDEERTKSATDTTTGVEVPVAIPTTKLQSDNISPELTVTWRPSEDLTVFGSLKKGFKSGSFNMSTPAVPGRDDSFGDEKVEGGEVGLKSRWLNRQLIANLAFYDYRYTGLQVGTGEPPVGGVPITRTLNAGSALVYGIDFDLSYRPEQVEGLELHGAVNWNHARFKTLNNIPCWGGQTIADGCNQLLNPVTGLFLAQDLSGSRLVRAPDWQANFGFSYEMAVGKDLRLVLASDTQYSSKYLSTLGRRSDFFQDSFVKTDLSLALKGPNDRWELALIGKNLTDEHTTSHCDPFNVANTFFGGQVTGGTGRGPAGVDETMCFVDRGREVWLRATFRPFS